MKPLSPVTQNHTPYEASRGMKDTEVYCQLVRYHHSGNAINRRGLSEAKGGGRRKVRCDIAVQTEDLMVMRRCDIAEASCY